MGLGPKQMQESIIRNLKEKTGKDLSEWLAVIQQSNLSDKKEIMAALKSGYGLGHFQAKIVSEQALNADQYEDTSSFADNIFKTAQSIALFEFAKAKILAVGSEVKEQPCRTYIPYYRKHQFALIKQDKAGIFIGLNLPDDYQGELLSPAKGTGSDRINWGMTLSENAQWNEELDQALQMAYRNN